MKTINLIQGSELWHAHRATHFNASDAPAMMGCSPYKTRTQLMDELSGKALAEIDAGTQKRFDDGHRFEALARPLAEVIIGEELFPCTGEDGKLSASFDGLTLMYDTAWEHKGMGGELRAFFADVDTMPPDARESSDAGRNLPLHYRVQMEQQAMVSGCDRILFMASKWDSHNILEVERHCWYAPDSKLRTQIIAGWAQLERDLIDHKPKVAVVEAVGRSPDSLPALHIELTGLVTASNLTEFRDHAIAVFRGISTDLQTDQDFADADKTVKWCGDIEDRLKAAKDHALSQTQTIDELFRAIDSISAEARSKRLELEKLVKARKEAVRGEIAYAGRDAIAAHYATINATLGEHAIAVPATIGADLNAATKGKRTVASIRDAVDTSVASAKIAASQKADQVRSCIAVMAEHAKGHESLFADRVMLCASKAPEDLRNLIAARITEHVAREQARENEQREKIRVEEEGKARKKIADEAAEELAAAKQSTGAELSPAAQKLNDADGELRFAEHHRTVIGKASAPAQRKRPSDREMAEVLANHYRVADSVIVSWLREIDLTELAAA